ncbi:hypothetical protein [Rhodoferax sp.]|uniref:hypothetical protein n=1 Tax=Rhodoferax sp. TaxID=50421 RepID=UPI00276571B2|nr:hypothetical protein [Rhodoferax sp.]
MKRFPLLFALLVSALLSGCFWPEKFDAKVIVNPDASYAVKFTGRVAHVPMVMQMVTTKQPPSAKDEVEVKRVVDRVAKDPEVKNIAYLGNGRFNLETEAAHKAGTKTNLMGMIIVSTDKSGVMTIASGRINDKDKAQLKDLGLTVTGNLEVALPKNVEVISSNATSSPKFFGLVGTHSWKIGSSDDASTS